MWHAEDFLVIVDYCDLYSLDLFFPIITVEQCIYSS